MSKKDSSAKIHSSNIQDTDLGSCVKFTSETEKEEFLKLLSKHEETESEASPSLSSETNHSETCDSFIVKLDEAIDLISQSLDPEERKGSIKLAILSQVRSVLSRPTVKLWDWLCLVSNDYFATTPIDKVFYHKGLTEFPRKLQGKTSFQQAFSQNMRYLTSGLIFNVNDRKLYKANGTDAGEVILDANYFIAPDENLHFRLFNLEFSTAKLFELFHSTLVSDVLSERDLQFFVQKQSESDIEKSLIDTYWDQVESVVGEVLEEPNQTGRIDFGYVQRMLKKANLTMEDTWALTSPVLRSTYMGYTEFRPRLCTLTQNRIDSITVDLPLTTKLLYVNQWLALPACSPDTMQMHCKRIKALQKDHSDISLLSNEEKVQYQESVDFLNTHRTKQALFNIVEPKTTSEWRVFANYVFSGHDQKKREPYGCVVNAKFRAAESRH